MNLAKNPSFENGWHQAVPTSGNQEPNDWQVAWASAGEPMLSAGFFPNDEVPIFETVMREPECVHLRAPEELPPDEWPGGEDELVLGGRTVYKNFGGLCSTTLWQELTGLEPNKEVVIRVPLQVHDDGDGSYGACAARVWANGVSGSWLTFHGGFPDPADPHWVVVEIRAEVEPNGELVFGVDLESRAEAAVSFFIDMVSVEYVEEPTEPPATPGTVLYYNRMPYPKTVHVPHQGSTLQRYLDIASIAYETNATVSFSADDALGHEPNQAVQAIFYDVSESERPAYQSFRDEYYPGASITFLGGDTDDTWTTKRYIEKGTALSFHCFSYPVDFINQLSAQGVTLSSVKLVNSFGDLPICNQQYRLVRKSDRQYEGFDYQSDPVGQAINRMNELMPFFEPHKQHISFIEIVNEAKPPFPGTHINMASFFLSAMDIAEQHGYKIACFSHSVGTPEPEDWEEIVPTGVFEKIILGGHAISLHEYGDASYGPNEIICRYQYLYEQILTPIAMNLGKDLPPLFITEYNTTSDKLSSGVFEQWVMYDKLVRKDPYFAGAHIFTVGSGMGWDNYHNATVAQFARFKDYAIAEKDVNNGQGAGHTVYKQ